MSIAKAILEIGKRGFTSAAKRFDTDTWKMFAKSVDNIQASMGRRMGEFDVKLADTGLLKLKKDQLKLVKPAMEGKTVVDTEVQVVAGNIRKLLDDIHGSWVSQGGKTHEVKWNFDELGKLQRSHVVRPTDYIQNYFPHRLRRDIAEKLFEDATETFNEAKGQVKDFGNLLRAGVKVDIDEASMPILESLVKKRMAIEGYYKNETLEAIRYMISRNPEMTPGQAMRIIHDRASSSIFNPMGSLEKARTSHLPDHFWDDDAVRILRGYGHGWARRASEAEQWGMGYENLLNMIGAAGRNESKAMEQVASYITGAGEFKADESWRRITNLFTEFEVTSKIGLGTAVIPNISQPTISIIPKAGIFRVLRGVANLFTEGGAKKVRQSGVLSRGSTAVQVFSGNWADALSIKHLDIEGLKWYEKLSRITTTTATAPFNVVNRMLNIVSASTAEVYIKDLVKIAKNSSGARKSWALKQLGVLNVNPQEPLTNKRLLEGMYRFAIDSQLQRDVLRDPVWMNDPRFRFLALFKRFGYRQFTYVKDRLIKDELSRGNVFPIMRLLAGGIAGGEFVKWAKDGVRREIFGAPDLWTEEDSGMFQRALDSLVAVGSLGVFSDVARLKGEDFSSAWNEAIGNTFFAIEPLAVSELVGIPGSYTRSGWPQWARQFSTTAFDEGAQVAWEKHSKALLRQLSPLGSMIAAGAQRREEEKKALIKAMRR